MYASAIVLALAGLASAQNLTTTATATATACSGGVTQSAGVGPIPTPDTPGAFLALSAFPAAATSAATPPGYTLAFANLHAAVSSTSYLGYYTLTSYSPAMCAARCSAVTGCTAFNTC